MARGTYVTSAEVQDLLTGMGLTPDAGYDYTSDINSVVEEFERRTGRPQFLSDLSSVSVRFDPPDGRDGKIRLYIWDWYVITAVVVGYSLTESGTTLTEETDYWLVHECEGDDTTPIVGIDFVSWQTSFDEPKSIRITGRRGYAATLPADVKQAILAECASMYLLAKQGNTGLVARQKQGDREVEYRNDKAELSPSGQLHSQFEKCVSRRLRIS